MREQAAGRAGSLAEERTRLAKEQADKLALENMISRKEYAPISIIEETMASTGKQIAGILEALPVKLKREAKLKTRQVKIVEREIAVARNVAADVKPCWDDIDQPEGEDGE